jgi:transcriptional regulator with XRE-family HTH domain
MSIFLTMETPDISKNLGKAIRDARKRRDVSQGELAKRIGMSRPSLSAYENGKTTIGVDVMTAVANALDTGFALDGYAVTRQTLAAAVVESDQLCFEFGTEQIFTDATVRIRPSKDTLVITTIIPQIRSVS